MWALHTTLALLSVHASGSGVVWEHQEAGEHTLSIHRERGSGLGVRKAPRESPVPWTRQSSPRGVVTEEDREQGEAQRALPGWQGFETTGPGQAITRLPVPHILMGADAS